MPAGVGVEVSLVLVESVGAGVTLSDVPVESEGVPLSDVPVESEGAGAYVTPVLPEVVDVDVDVSVEVEGAWVTSIQTVAVGVSTLGVVESVESPDEGVWEISVDVDVESPVDGVWEVFVDVDVESPPEAHGVLKSPVSPDGVVDEAPPLPPVDHEAPPLPPVDHEAPSVPPVDGVDHEESPLVPVEVDVSSDERQGFEASPLPQELPPLDGVPQPENQLLQSDVVVDEESPVSGHGALASPLAPQPVVTESLDCLPVPVEAETVPVVLSSHGSEESHPHVASAGAVYASMAATMSATRAPKRRSFMLDTESDVMVSLLDPEKANCRMSNRLERFTSVSERGEERSGSLACSMRARQAFSRSTRCCSRVSIRCLALDWRKKRSEGWTSAVALSFELHQMQLTCE